MWLRCLARGQSSIRGFYKRWGLVTTLCVGSCHRSDYPNVRGRRCIQIGGLPTPRLNLEGCQREEFCYFTIIETNTKRHPFYTRPHSTPYTPPHGRRHTTPHHTWTFYLTPAVLTRYCQVAKCTTIYNDFFSVFLCIHTPFIYRTLCYSAINQ